MRVQTGFENYLTNILETVAEGIVLIDADGRFSFVNSAAQNMFATPRAEILGRGYDDPIWNFTRPDGSPVPIEEMPPSIVMRTHRSVFDTVFGARLPDGRQVMLTINAVPFRDDDGEVIGSLLSFSDITRRVRIERLDHALSGIGTAVNSSFDFDMIMQKALDMAVDALGCDSGLLFILEGTDWVLRYLCNLPEDMREVRIPEEQASFTLLSGGETGALAFNDAYTDPRIDSKVMHRFKIRALLDVTLKVRDRAIADVSFIYRSSSGQFTQDDIDFANRFGALVGLALKNSELYRSEQDISTYLQKALVGDPAPISGLVVSDAYRSGTKSAFVGGDFYDVFQIDGDRVALVLGDVSGHGLPKATLAAMSKHTMIAFLLEGEAPARVAERSDAIIARSTDESTFITAVVGVLDKASGRFEYCNCGHPEPLVLRTNGSTDHLRTRSPLLGSIPGAEFRQGDVILSPGDVLLLFTDGVTEARGERGMFGESGVEEWLRDSAEVPVAGLSERLLNRVSDFASGKLTDDVAIMALQLTGFNESDDGDA